MVCFKHLATEKKKATFKTKKNIVCSINNVIYEATDHRGRRTEFQLLTCLLLPLKLKAKQKQKQTKPKNKRQP